LPSPFRIPPSEFCLAFPTSYLLTLSSSHLLTFLP
jgi:hypothetical protein